MKIIIKGIKLELTPAIQEFVATKFSRLQKFIKHWDEKGSAMLRVEVSRATRHHKKGDIFSAEVNLDLPRAVLRAEAVHENLRTALNDVYNKLKLEVKKRKDKVTIGLKRVRREK